MKMIIASAIVFSISHAYAENQTSKKVSKAYLNKSEESLIDKDSLEMDQMIIGDYDSDTAPVHKRRKLEERSKISVEKKIEEIKLKQKAKSAKKINTLR